MIPDRLTFRHVRLAALLLATVSAVIAGRPAAPFAAERGHAAHQHGVGRLNVAVDGNAVEIALEMPGADIVGFEHPAGSPAERAAVAEAIAALKDGAGLFLFPAAAGCRIATAEVESSAHEQGGKHGGEHAEDRNKGAGAADRHNDDGHSEFHARYRFACDRPDAIDAVDVRLFSRFPAARELDVQAVTARGQTAQELTPDTPKLKF